MKYILILAISTVLLLKSSIQSDHSEAYSFETTKRFNISFNGILSHDEDMKSILKKSLLECSPREIDLLKIENVSTGKIFEHFSFLEFEKLKYLYIESGQIDDFPESTFEGLKELVTLQLSNIRLKSVPKNLSKFMPNLRELILENNALEYLPDDYFKNFHKLREISVKSNHLTTLPTGIFKFIPKEAPYNIYLTNNRIETLKEDVFDAKDLQILDLSHNNVSKIDKNTFKKLSKVLTINLTATFNAEVVNLPKELFSNLSNLQTIIMTGNHFQSLEVGIFQTLQELQDLDLSFNKLKNLPEEIFKDNIHLRKLNLSNNYLRSLSSNTFMNLTELLELDLSHNNLKDLDAIIFFNLKTLSDLYISHNEVNLDSPNGSSVLQYCVNLTKIYARNNKISKVFPDWRGSSKLVVLDLTSNPLLQSEMNMTSKFPKQFYFTSHNSTNVKFETKLFQSLGLGADKTYILDRNSQCGADGNSNCSCRILINDALKKITLKCNRFEEEKLNKWPPYFVGPQTEKYDVELILANCNIANLYEVNKYVREVGNRLSKLVLSGNKLTSLHGLERNLPALKVLELDGNQFTIPQLPDIEILKSYKNLTNITLSRNPWTCNCDLEYFYNFMQENEKLILDKDEVVCSNIDKTPMLKLAFYNYDFCRYYFKMSVVGILFAMLAFSGIAAMYFFHVYEKEIKVWIFSKPCLRFLVTEKELDRHLPFDAFISYAARDEKFVLDELVPELECGERPYKLCIHLRDWPVGGFVPAQIYRSVEQSRRTIIVLSPNFLNSFWGKREFQTAYLKSMKEQCPRILIILLDDIGDINNLDDEMKAYISTNTYLEWKDPRFWQKLRYALPHTYRIRCRRTGEELLPS